MANMKVPPNNNEAEESVLGAILIDKDSIGLVSEIVKPFDFYNDVNGIIFEAMLSLFEERKPIDVLTLTQRLKKNKEDKLEKLLDKAESSIFAISQGHNIKGFTTLKESLAQSFERIDELHKKGSGFRGIQTGFTDLDNILSGMQESNLLILAARPGQGKTAMIINIAQNIAVAQKLPVGIFSLEMSQEELVDRLLIGQADIDAWRLKTGKLVEADFTKLSTAMGELADAPIYIDDVPGLSISEIRTKAIRLQLEYGVKLLIVDYLQLADPGKRYDNRVQEVSIVSQGLKNLAR